VNRRIITLMTVGVAAVGIVIGTAEVQAGADSAHIRHLSAPVQARSAAPHIAPMAGQLTGALIPNGKGPHVVPEPANIDGCDHDYGNSGQCVPWTIPGSTITQRCAWLTAHGFGPLAVAGTDRQALNPAHDKTTCTAKDLKAGKS
jgi:hypothetical protein